MKTTKLLSIAVLLGLLFTSCDDKDPDAPFIPTPENSTTINFEVGYLTSDKPSEQISPTKDYEDKITTLRLWVFKGANDEAIFSREFSGEEITAMKAKIQIEKVQPGEKLTVMTVANLDYITTTSKKKLLEDTDADPSRYNSENYKDMTTKSVKEEGFTMSSTDEIITSSETVYTIKNKLQKNVAKIEIIMDNKYMREENTGWNDKAKGFFKAEYMTMLSNGCSTQIFGKIPVNSVMNPRAAAIQPSEFISQGIGYFCYKPSNSYSFDIQLEGTNKSPGSLIIDKYGYRARHNGSILPNKHYIIKCKLVGNSRSNVDIVSFEEKDWVKTN